MKALFYKLIRPLHRPITKYLRNRLTRNFIDYPEINLPNPWELVQLQVERHLHNYLHCQAEEIKNIVIVGANYADEIPRLKRMYTKSRFVCYEPSPKWFEMLEKNYADCDYVTSKKLAISDFNGPATFYELPMPGNGSLLNPDVELWSKFNNWADKKTHAFAVEVKTLDEEMESLDSVDLLWVDVQGGEGGVLRGATKTLAKTKAVLLEIAISKSPYEGAVLFDQLDSLLRSQGFSCAGLGLDSWNYTGNALWIKNCSDLICKKS